LKTSVYKLINQSKKLQNLDKSSSLPKLYI